MGFNEYFEPPYIALVEWPDILKMALPREYYWITLTHHAKGREITIEKRVKEQYVKTSKRDVYLFGL